MKRPWIKFYPADWRADPCLRMCSVAARGVWIDLISYMHEGEPYGHLTVHGMKPSIEDIASLIACPKIEVIKALSELERRQVSSRTADGVIFSRRMVRDNQKAIADHENGKGGGNPGLIKGVNPPDIAPDKAQMLDARCQNLEKEKEPLSEPSSDASAPRVKKSRKAYPEAFEAFWKAYPTDGLMSKLEASKAWERLSTEDQAAGLAGVPTFIAYCRAHPDYRPVHACRYISQRRFDGFAPMPTASLIAPEGCPTSEELRRKYANAAPVVAGRGAEIPPVDASGAGPRPAKQQLGGHPARIGGARRVGSILQGLGLGAAGIQETRARGNLHDADPVAGLATNGMGTDGDDSQDYPLQTEWPIQ